MKTKYLFFSFVLFILLFFSPFSVYAQPDLSGAWSDISKKEQKNKYKVTGNLTISNTGYITAKNVIVNIYISDDTTYDSTDLYLYSKNFGTIKSSKLKTKKIKYTFDSDPAGKYLLAVIDPEQSIQELYENNNLVTSNVIPPPPIIADPLDTWHLRLEYGDIIPSGISKMIYEKDLFFAVGWSGIFISSDGLTWQKTEDLDVTDITYGNGIFVCIGGSGTIATSTDGENWSIRNSGTQYDLYEVTYANGLFIVIGYGGIILTSSDGLNWTVNLSIKQPIRAITYGNGIYVAVGDNGAIFTSSDSNTWVSKKSGISTALNNITYGNGLFVAVGDNGIIVTSLDGDTWIAAESGTTNSLIGIVYGNGQFVVLSFPSVLTSSDGINWIITCEGIYFQEIKFANNTFMATSGDYIGLSSDGITWEILHISGIGQDLNDTSELHTCIISYSDFKWTFGNGMFVGLRMEGDSRGEYYSTMISQDGVNWTIRPLGSTSYFNYDYLRGFAYGNGLYIVTGNSTFLSHDGLDWLLTGPLEESCSNISYGNNLFVAVGNLIETSSDGINWTTVFSDLSVYLNSVIYSEKGFIAVGNAGNILTSIDGYSWSNRYSGTMNNLQDVAYGNNTFVTVGEIGEIITSQDGTIWTQSNSGTLHNLYETIYGNGLFVVVGSYCDSDCDGIIMVSSDTLNWDIVHTEIFERVDGFTDYYPGVAFGEGIFLVEMGGKLLSSNDGINWKSHEFQVPPGSDLVFAKETFMAVGGSSMYQSDPY